MTLSNEMVSEIETCLDRLPVPVLTSYLKMFGLPVNGSKAIQIERCIAAARFSEKPPGSFGPLNLADAQLVKKIDSRISEGRDPPDLRALMEYVDDSSKYGRQEIFLFRLYPEKTSALEDLRNKDRLRERLEKTGKADFLNQKPFVWDAASPVLAEMIHRYENGEGELVLKWVETRSWLQRIKTDSGVPRFDRRRERSVNYFRLDLRDGWGEIRIQALQANPAVSLAEELKIYRNEISNVVPFDDFFPVPVEPIIKKLIVSREMKIHYWKIALSDGGTLAGARDPGLYQKIKLRFRGFMGCEVRGDWEKVRRSWGPEKVYTQIDAGSGALYLSRICDPDQNKALIGRIKDLGRDAFHIPEIRELAGKRCDLDRILWAVDQKINQSDDRMVRSRQLKDLHFSENQIRQVFEALLKASSLFKALTENGQASLAYIRKRPRGGLIGFLEKLFGRPLTHGQKTGILALCLMIVFILLGYQNLVLFLPLLKVSQKGSALVLAGCLLNILLLLACFIMIFGRKAVKEAFRLGGKLVSSFWDRLVKGLSIILKAILAIKEILSSNRRRRRGTTPRPRRAHRGE